MSDLASDPGWASRQAELFAGKLRQFATYLRDRGVVFDLSGMAVNGGGQAETAIVPAEVDVRILATHSLVSQITVGDETDLSPAEVRREVVERLWLNYRWHEPWISLVNQEFPGPEPSADDVLAFEAKRAEVSQARAETNEELSGLVREIELELGDPTLNDDLAVTSLAMLVFFGRMTSRLSGISTDATLMNRRMSAIEIVQRSRRPEDGAWQAVLDHYFPIPG